MCDSSETERAAAQPAVAVGRRLAPPLNGSIVRRTKGYASPVNLAIVPL
jgi:hypothetical protein